MFRPTARKMLPAAIVMALLTPLSAQAKQCYVNAITMKNGVLEGSWNLTVTVVDKVNQHVQTGINLPSKGSMKTVNLPDFLDDSATGKVVFLKFQDIKDNWSNCKADDYQLVYNKDLGVEWGLDTNDSGKCQNVQASKDSCVKVPTTP